MRGNVVRLTVGDYLYRVPGFIDNVSVTVDNSNTSWEIVLQKDEYPDVAQLPHLVTVSVSFKPIMNFLPRRENADNPVVPLISTNGFLQGASIGKRGVAPIIPAVEGVGFGRDLSDLSPIAIQRRNLITNAMNATINPNLVPNIQQRTGQ